jgi:hypothetical protein
MSKCFVCGITDAEVTLIFIGVRTWSCETHSKPPENK